MIAVPGNDPACRKESASSCREDVLPWLFFFLALLFNPSLYFAPHRPWPLLAVSCGALSLTAGAFLFLSPGRVPELFRRMKPFALFAMAYFFLTALIQCFVLPGYSLECAGSNLIFVLVPLFVCVWGKKAEKPFLFFLFVLWGWGFFLMGLARMVRVKEFWLSGITANSNWSAALIAVGTPFVVLTLHEFLRKRGTPERTALILCALPAFAGLGCFLLCRSLGCFLALCAVTPFLFFCLIPVRMRRIFFLAAVICVAAGTLLYLRFGMDRLAWRLAYDSRPTIWEGAVNMIVHHPVFGVGGQSFENAFVKYRPLEYFLKLQVASRMTHPHNQVLFMCAVFGIPCALAWMFLHFYPLAVVGIRLWKKKEDLAVLPYFFGLALLTLHAQLDVVSVNWPTNVMELALLGFLWRRTLLRPEKEGPEGSETLPVKPFLRNASFFCGFFILLFLVLPMVLRSTCASFLVQDLMTEKYPLNESRKKVRRVLRIYPEGYEQTYALLSFSRLILNDPVLTLEITDVMREQHVPEYSCIHLFRGDALSLLKKYDEAFVEYSLEARNWPLAVVPVCKMLVIAQKKNDQKTVASLQQILASIMKAKNINRRMLDYILYKDPFMDFHPWKIPREYGGPGWYGKPVPSE